MNRGAGWARLAMVCAVLVALPAAAEELGFVRVNVPAGGLRQVPLDGGRYVPMPLAEFEDAVARLGAAGRSARQPVAVEARYTLALDAAGRLAGTLEFELAAGGVWLPAHLPLGHVTASAGTIQTSEGTGEASIFCLPDGECAMRTPGPGRYACTIRLPAAAGDATVRLPLLPALVTTVAIDLPVAVRPIVTGSAAAAAAVDSNGDRPGAWRIVRGPVGPGSVLPLVLWDGRRLPAPLAAWNAVAVVGRQAEVVARIEPAAAWTPERFELAAPATMRITGATAADAGQGIPWTRAGDAVLITPPDRLVGTRTGIVVTAVVPIATEEPTTLPVLQPAIGRWGGCGVRLIVDPALAVQRLEMVECLAVSAAVGDRWPVPARAAAPAAAGLEPALVHLEHQSPAARARVVVGPREATLDTARVTTVDISPGTVLGRTTADVRVVAGQVFDMTADVARGWFIDSVEAIDAPRGRDGEPAAAPGRPLEWRVVRSPQGSELRIGLAEAATPRRGVGLRITGHRSGLPLGAEFSSDDIDMVRFPGEQAMLEFQVGPTAVLESPGGPLGLDPLPDRLAPLSGLASPRARIAAGDRAPAVRTRLVRRRPPVQAEVGVELVARDERLAETFTFSCRPVAGELDAVVVHFSEPMGSGLEWSMADPLAGSLSAQPLDPGDATRGDLRIEEAVAESWLVEIRPATAAGVRFRAARTVPLEAAVPVPLAWIEAAENPAGTVTIRGEAGERPEVANRRLRELPPGAEAAAGTVELAYGAPPMIAGGGPAAEVLPPADAAAARAWAWRQSTVCWCYESGDLEWETTFDVENLGRESVTLALPAGMRVERVTVADEPVAAALTDSGANALAIPLPSRTGRLRIQVRGVGGGDERLGWWRIGDIACGIDVPVLERDARLMLPPGLVATAEANGRGPLEQLVGAGSAGAVQPSTERGFRGVALADAGPAGAGVLVIRRRWIWSLAIAAGCGAALLARALAQRSGPAALAACGGAALAALWCGTPWDAVARAALWGGIVGLWAAGRQSAGLVPAGAAVVMAAIGLAGPAAGSVMADEGPPLRVFVTPGSAGGTALVPERLFRRLVDTTGAGLPSLRVLGTETSAAAGAWRISLELQADPGGLLLLDQAGTAATWVRVGERSRGLDVTIDAEGRVARVVAAEAGRHRLELELLPGTTRAGDLESMIARLPPAPRAVLRIEEPGAGGAAGGWQCDRAGPEGGWLPVAGGGPFDVAGATRVRLVRPLDPSLKLATGLAAAVSFNDIIWRGDECRVAASFDVGGEGTIVRSLTLRADPAVEPVAAAGGLVPRPLGAGRHLVEIPEPRAGQRRIAVEFRMPLTDPVGVFDAPFAWLEGVETDVRTARLRPEPGVEAAVELPPGMALVRPRAEDGAGTTAVWRCDAVATAEAVGGTELRPRITVRRSLPRPRAAQDLMVSFADGHVGLRLVYQVEAADSPVVEIPVQLPPAAIIEDIVLTRQSAGDAAERSWRRVDLFWSRAAADRIVAVVQRPEAGPHRLQLDARLPIRPASRGRLPLARVVGDDVPLELRWRAEAGMTVTVEAEPRSGESGGERLELPAGKPAPAYRLSRDEAPPTPGAGGADAAPAGDPRPAVASVPRTLVDLAIDASGRAWGLARFDLLARDREVTVTLPAGLRLFGLRADGREVTATPLGGNAWQLRLHDVGWPRSLVAVVAGSVGSGLARGEPIRLEPPRINGLSPAAVVWSLQTPAGLAVRVSEPARVLDDESLDAWNAPAVEQVGQAFAAAIQAGSGSQRSRLDAYAAASRAGAASAGERDWYDAWRGSSALEPQRVRVVAAEDGTVTFRAVRVAGGPRAARGLVTAAICAAVLGCWLAARRWPALAGIVSPLLRRWWWAACGIAWLVFLEPAAPGVVMLIAGAWLAAPRRPEEQPSSSPGGGNDSTLTFAAD
jgi:hypothetical protein